VFGLVALGQVHEHRVARRALDQRAMAEALALPMIRSPSQSPGTARSATTAGRSEMLIMSGRTRFLRWAPWRLGWRNARPVRRHTARSRRSAPRDCT
jgi:hypothetical protein